MKVPKLTPVGSELARVETSPQQQEQIFDATSNLERQIVANQIIVDVIATINVANKELEPFIAQNLSDARERLNEQKLSFQLLRLLGICKGDKGLVAEQLKTWIDNHEKNF